MFHHSHHSHYSHSCDCDLREELVDCPDCDGHGYTDRTNCCGARLADPPDGPDVDVVCPVCHTLTSIARCETCDGEGHLGTESEFDEIGREQALEDLADRAREDAL